MLPDEFTHLLFGVSLAILICRRKTRPEAMLVILGSLLPDVERPFTWVLLYFGYDLHLGHATHSIIGVLVLAYAASSCFEFDNIEFNYRFRLIIIGCVEHLILDMTMWPWEEMGFYLYYPIKFPISFHLFWSDYPWVPIFGFVAIMISIVLWHILGRLANAETVTS